MRLDKDIHSKLVNPQQSSTLEKNVKGVLGALGIYTGPFAVP